jgi:transposase InsO family protein
MPWKEASVIALRKEFVDLAKNDGNISRVCRNFGISRKTGYKWMERFEATGEEGLNDLSRRPEHSPCQITNRMEEAIIGIRVKNRTWGGRKIRRRLQDLGHTNVPAASTISEVLKRNGFIDEMQTSRHQPFVRFEREYPNDLWQMDFKGHVACPEGRCHPLTILDDASRFSLALKACLDERRSTVQMSLTETFRRYGLPNQIITDNGPPWGNSGCSPYTKLTVWLMRLGILVSHSAPAHPETLGKDERFHRTFKAELLGESLPWRNEEAQRRFDAWRFTYNHHRPHEALDMEVPARRYQISNRSFSECLPTIEYGSGDIVRKVQQRGIVHFLGREFQVSRALIGQPVALRPRAQCDGIFDLYFVRQLVLTINFNDHD